MRTRVTLAAFAVAALASTPLANAQSAEFMFEAQAASTAAGSSIPAGSLGSIGAPEDDGPALGTNRGTVDGDRSVGCDVNWVAEAINARTVGEGDLYLDRDGKPVNSPANGGFVSELSSGFDSPGELQLQHWINGNTFYWRTPVATQVPINDAVLTLTFQPNTFTAAPTSQDVGVSFFKPRASVFGMPDYAWSDNAGEPTVSGSVEEGFTLTYKLGDLDAKTGVGVQVGGPVAPETNSMTGTATLTGTYPVGSGTCTPVQGSIAGTPLGSLAGSLGDLGS